MELKKKMLGEMLISYLSVSVDFFQRVLVQRYSTVAGCPFPDQPTSAGAKKAGQFL